MAESEESLINRVQQLERERDELRKDIEQLCMQQAGPSYLVVATRMHFQRTAGLEQEIENLKKKLAICTRDNLNLQEELSEVYHIKSQLADLHSAEVSKNMDAEKQVKFFQGCVAAAFAERDHALMEAEKAKDREEAMSREINNFQERIEELKSVFLEEKELRAAREFDLAKLKEQGANIQKVIDKFYDIRQSFFGVIEDNCLDAKCECLLQDAPEWWSFDNHMETSTSEYIVGLEKEAQTLKNTVDNLQNKLQLGLEIEDHLRKNVFKLEREKALSDQVIKSRLSELHHSHIQCRLEVMDLLEHEKSQFKMMVDTVYDRVKQLQENKTQNLKPLQREEKIDDVECRDVHITTDADSSVVPEKNVSTSPISFAEQIGDTSDVLAQALREKVSALLFLSQQEERHLLERNVTAALEKKMEELQRNLTQVTNEKVKALMELAQLRQDYQLLQENIREGTKQANFPDSGYRSIVSNEADGRLRNMLKKTYLRRWIGRQDPDGHEADGLLNYNEGNLNDKKANSPIDFARMKIENATLKESVQSMDRLTYSIHRLRLSLSKARDSLTSSGPVRNAIEVLDGIIAEAKLVKTALGSSLPVSWSAETDPESFGSLFDEPTANSSGERLDFVSAAGFEMVELLILAAQLLKEAIG